MGYNVFAVTPASNSDDKNDATGAFIPGAQRLAHAYGGSFKSFDNVGADTKEEFPSDDQGRTRLARHVRAILAMAGRRSWEAPKSIRNRTSTTLPRSCRENSIRTPLSRSMPAGRVPAGGFSTKLQEKIGCGVWVYGHTTQGTFLRQP